MSGDENTHYKNLEPGHHPVPIVAIGGSAGGQQAITELLRHLAPDTGLAFVYIQHLSPDYDSQLDVILSAATSMKVSEAEHLMRIQPNQLYVIPPDKDMEVIDGVLGLTVRKPRPEIHLPIDQFFTSLAERQRDGAIGIVLSGMASDGTQGLKAIKVAGGITFAQDQTARFQSMPQSAINEGVVDMVLSPKEMAAELLRLSKKADVFQLTNETSEVGLTDSSDKELNKILTFLKTAVGVDFGHYKKSTIRRRIIRRMLLYKLETLSDYINYLKTNPSEAGILYSDLLINVTSFFRDEETMDYLKRKTLPLIIKNKEAADTLRIWIAGCSTGQEAYSIAIMLLEILGENTSVMPIQIFATDLSETAISKARIGIYPKSEIADISPSRLEQFLTKIDDQYRINKVVRDLCIFAPHDLLSDPPFKRLDLISCRNLLIYLDEVLQKKVLSTFHYALKPTGFLLLGKSESTGGSTALFSQIEKVQKVFTRKNNTPAKMSLDMTMKTNQSRHENKTINTKNNEIVTVNDLDKLVDNLLLAKYVPASVVVDQDMEIIQFRGTINIFLQPSSGKASLNLTKMAHSSLVFELRNIIHKARKTAQPAKKNGLEINVNDKVVYVSIEAVPITNPANQQLFLILFEEVQENIALQSKSSGDADKRNLSLESELTALRQDMHSIIEEQEASNEELQSANEEIVSSNEELQSINEELETSKEEIESANEELQTINQELQVRNDQLTESYEYSEAILSTIKEATLVLDNQLRIKSANTAFYKIFHADSQNTEGSMIYEIGNRQLDFDVFRNLMHDVITRNVSIEGFEVKIRLAVDDIERIMLIHARKVVQHQKQTIFLVFEDITEHRRVQNLLKERQQWFEELVDNAPALIWVAGVDGKLTYLNKAWVDFTGQSFDKNQHTTFFESIHPADQSSYEDTYFLNISEQKPFSFEYRIRRSDGEFRWVLENSKPMFSTDGQFTGYVGSCTEVHLQKTLTQQLNRHVDDRTRELKVANAELEITNHELIQTADRLQSVLNGVPAAVTLMEVVNDTTLGDAIDFITSVYNEQALEFAGLPASDLLNRTLLETNPGIRESGLFDLYLSVLNTGKSAYQEISNLRPFIEETLAYLITRQVDKKGIVVTILDITKRKETETRLTQTAESLQAVLDSSPGAIGFFKGIFSESGEATDFNLVVCNQKFSRSFKKSTTKLIGSLASKLYSEQRLDRMKQVLAKSESFYEEIYVEEQSKWMGISMTRHERGVAITEIDITLLKEAENKQDELISQLEGSAELIHSVSTLKQYIQQRGEFLRSTSHDLRGSFGIIVGAATLLNLMDSEEERAKTLEMIQRNLRQVTQMMNQLLDYSRLESGQETVEISNFDAATMLEELCEGSKPLAAERNLWIKFTGPQSLPVQSDMVKIRRIVQNILLNALKYTHSGGVSVSWEDCSTTEEKSVWRIIIQDTGPGLPKLLLNRLLDTYIPESENTNALNLQSMLTNSSVSQGEGIGLFIVKRLCELLQGKMYIDSNEVSGTVIRIVLPKTSV